MVIGKYVFDRRLPKASWVRVEWWPNFTHRWAKFRLANCMQIHIGHLMVSFRMPYLLRSAKSLHPQLF